MLDSLLIQNYRGIKKIEIPALARVNLISGENNVGKSALLEAIYLYAYRGNLHHIQELLKLRSMWLEPNSSKRATSEYVEQLIDNYAQIFYNKKIDFFTEDGITIGATQANNQLKIRFVKAPPPQNQQLSNIPQKGVAIQFGDKKQTLSLYPNKQNPLDNFIITPKKCLYLSSNRIKIEQLSTFWNKVIFTPKENYVLQALRLVEARIEQLTFLHSHQKLIPYVKLKRDKKAHLLSDMGRGVEKLLTLLLTLLNSDNGFFLISEFENSLHPNIQPKLWEIIFQVAKKFNIQVFATTYSTDCIKAFATTCTQHKNLGQYYLLQKRSNGKITPLMYQTELLLFASKKEK